MTYHNGQGRNEDELNVAMGFIFQDLDKRADAAYDSLKAREKEIEDTRILIQIAMRDAKRAVRYVGELIASSVELDKQISVAVQDMVNAFKVPNPGVEKSPANTNQVEVP